MGEVGAAWWLWIVVLGGSGFVLGSVVLLTMPAPVILRLVAVGLVLAALVLAVGLNVVGLMPPSFGLFGVFLMPVLAAIGLRHLWSGAEGQHGLARD